MRGSKDPPPPTLKMSGLYFLTWEYHEKTIYMYAG